MVIYYKLNMFRISPVGFDDLAALIGHRNDFETWQYLTAVIPLMPSGQMAWFESLGTDQNRQYFILSVKAVNVGMVRIDKIDRSNRSCQVGLDIFKEYRGNRYSYSGWELILKYCFDELGMNRVWFLVLETNNIAMHTYNKIGFKREGVMRKAIYRGDRFLDYIMMSLLKEEYDSIVQR